VHLLHDNGIEFHGEHAVNYIDNRRNEIHFHNDAIAAFDLLVFVPPHEPAVTLDKPGWIAVDALTMQTRHPGIFAIGDVTAVKSPSGRPLPKAAIFAKNGAKAAALNALQHLGVTDTSAALSGEGYCYIDTGAGRSALGKGDSSPCRTPPSTSAHHQKPCTTTNKTKNTTGEQPGNTHRPPRASSRPNVGRCHARSGNCPPGGVAVIRVPPGSMTSRRRRSVGWWRGHGRGPRQGR
jgi:hypothetical protein